MFTKEKILYLIEYVKDNDAKKGDHLREVIKTHLSIDTPQGADATFLNHLERKGYISHDQSNSYHITKKGKRYFRLHKIDEYSKVIWTILGFLATILGILLGLQKMGWL